MRKSIARYGKGVKNMGGILMPLPDVTEIKNLGIDPEKAQMMIAQEYGVREVARLLGLPAYKLGVRDATAYASQVQAAIEYVLCLRPIATIFEQAIQRDLILAKDTYFMRILAR